MRPEGRPRDLEIQVARAEGRGGPARSALKVRDDDGTGPLTHGSGRLGSKDPAGISGCMSVQKSGAGDGNRTHVNSLEGCRTTIVLRPLWCTCLVARRGFTGVAGN